MDSTDKIVLFICLSLSLNAKSTIPSVKKISVIDGSDIHLEEEEEEEEGE